MGSTVQNHSVRSYLGPKKGIPGQKMVESRSEGALVLLVKLVKSTVETVETVKTAETVETVETGINHPTHRDVV